ncbi:MAG: hypothetical protein RLZZ350_2385 [Verrucomicrobiota bacterium]|jgi:integrase
MNKSQSESNQRKPKLYQPTQYANLIRYVPSGTYFARLRVAGKLIRQSLKTNAISVAKMRLADLQKSEREAAEIRQSGKAGKMLFGDCADLFLTQTDTSNLIKPTSKLYRRECVTSILSSWPELSKRDVRQINPAECESWGAKFSNEYSASRYNGAVGVFRQVFEVAIQAGALHRNPALGIKRAKVRLPQLTLPDSKQFNDFVQEIERGKGRDSKKCADMVRFLAYGGFRLSEAVNVTWADCDFENEIIVVRGDAETGTKNWTVRRVPMIEEMRGLLERMKTQAADEPNTAPVLRVKECLQAMTRAAKTIGIARITHHHLRHLFATRCIEQGVDIPTVSRWLGHKDGGALAMRVYGHLRDQHSVAMAKKVSFATALAA